MAEITHYTTDERGHKLAHYASGAIRDETARQLIHPATAGMITSETAPLMLQRRRAISEQQARDAIDEAAIEAGKMPLSKMGTGEGWYQIVRHTAAIFLKSENVRGLAEMFGKLGQAGGYISTQRVEVEGTVTHEHRYVEAAEQLMAFLKANRTEAIEGEITDDNG
jgi:hypothetical protein